MAFRIMRQMSPLFLDICDKCRHVMRISNREGVIMSFSRAEISDAGMVSRKKVDKDVERGNLDPGSLASVAGYVMAGRLSAGGIEAITGLVPEFSREPDSTPVNSSDEPLVSSELWSGMELMIMKRIEASGKSRKVAESQIKVMREHVGVDRLGEEHMEELGL